jgi:hypothetical protein
MTSNAPLIITLIIFDEAVITTTTGLHNTFLNIYMIRVYDASRYYFDSKNVPYLFKLQFRTIELAI